MFSQYKNVVISAIDIEGGKDGDGTCWTTKVDASLHVSSQNNCHHDEWEEWTREGWFHCGEAHKTEFLCEKYGVGAAFCCAVLSWLANLFEKVG